jgi:hypothetical protein
MISASTLVGTYPRARQVDAAMALAVSSHAAVPRTDFPYRASFGPAKLRPSAFLEPLVLVLTALGASLLLCTVFAGALP